MNAAEIINVIATALGLTAICLSAHYLSQLRDITRETRDLHRKVVERLGIVTQHR